MNPSERKSILNDKPIGLYFTPIVRSTNPKGPVFRVHQNKEYKSNQVSVCDRGVFAPALHGASTFENRRKQLNRDIKAGGYPINIDGWRLQNQQMRVPCVHL